MIVFIVLIVLDMSNRLENYRLSRHVHVVSSDCTILFYLQLVVADTESSLRGLSSYYPDRIVVEIWKCVGEQSCFSD